MAGPAYARRGQGTVILPTHTREMLYRLEHIVPVLTRSAPLGVVMQEGTEAEHMHRSINEALSELHSMLEQWSADEMRREVKES